MGDEIDESSMMADYEESDAQDTTLPEELEDRDTDNPEVPDEVDLPDPTLRGVG